MKSLDNLIVQDRSEYEVSDEDEDQSSMLGEVLRVHLLKNAVILLVFPRKLSLTSPWAPFLQVDGASPLEGSSDNVISSSIIFVVWHSYVALDKTRLKEDQQRAHEPALPTDLAAYYSFKNPMFLLCGARASKDPPPSNKKNRAKRR